MVIVVFLLLLNASSVLADDLSQESAFQIQTSYHYFHSARETGSAPRFLGLSLRYLYKPLDFSGFGLEPHAAVLWRAGRQADVPHTLYQAGLDASFTLLANSPYIGLSVWRGSAADSSFKYVSDLGFRIGYRYFFGRHMAGLGYDWVRGRGDNPPGLNGQRTLWSGLQLIYAYTF